MPTLFSQDESFLQDVGRFFPLPAGLTPAVGWGRFEALKGEAAERSSVK